MEKINGVTLYEPSELVLSARAGTSLAEIEKTLAKYIEAYEVLTGEKFVPVD